MHVMLQPIADSNWKLLRIGNNAQEIRAFVPKQKIVTKRLEHFIFIFFFI